jgi:hypothetical protein
MSNLGQDFSTGAEIERHGNADVTYVDYWKEFLSHAPSRILIRDILRHTKQRDKPLPAAAPAMKRSQRLNPARKQVPAPLTTLPHLTDLPF